MTISQDHRLIAVDCDGTLFDADGYPSTRTCEAVGRIVESGHCIVAATGRSQRTACPRLGMVPGMRYLVCSNGAYVWDMQEGGIVCESGALSQPLVAQIVAKLRDEIADVTFGWESRGGLGFEDAFIELAGGVDQLENGGQSGDPWSQDLYKLKVRHPGMPLDELLRQVVSLLGDNLCEITTSGAPFIEISAPGSNKAAGLDRLAELLGFTAAGTIVFGDNYNDLPMFRWAAHSVAMGNAEKAVKAEAHAVTLSNTDHGVAHYLEKLMIAGSL